MMKVEWIQPDGPITEKIIYQVEQYFGVEFPKDYKKCIKQFNGGYPEPDIFNVNIDNDAVFSCLLSFTSNQVNIIEVYDIESKILPGGVYPFARDPFGNLICFDYRKNFEVPTIIFFDHEVDGPNAIYYICDTFTELIESLYSIDE